MAEDGRLRKQDADYTEAVDEALPVASSLAQVGPTALMPRLCLARIGSRLGAGSPPPAPPAPEPTQSGSVTEGIESLLVLEKKARVVSYFAPSLAPEAHSAVCRC